MAHEGGWHPLEAVSKLAKMPVVTSLRQVVEKRLRLFEVRRVKAFGKPFVDGREKLSSLGAAPLVAAEPGEAYAASVMLLTRRFARSS